MIEVRELIKTFGFHPVLRKLDLDVERGQFVALLGPNGSGKTTLLRILAALSNPTAGTVKIGGWEFPGEAFAVRQQLGVVSHLSLLYDNLTPLENLRFFASLYDIPNSEARIQEVLERVGLKYRANDLVRTFSRGMLQRLTIARAILHKPAVLLFDEPYTGLDQDAAATLDELLTDLTSENRTIVMTTHDLRRAHALASHLVILRQGKVGYFGASADITPQDIGQVYSETISSTGQITGGRKTA